MPAPYASVSFSSLVDAMEQKEAERRGRERRMQNALEILADSSEAPNPLVEKYARFVRRTAREGLGRE